jgi:hypothetical protein
MDGGACDELLVVRLDLGKLLAREVGPFLRHGVLALEVDQVPLVGRPRFDERQGGWLIEEIAFAGKTEGQLSGDRCGHPHQLGVDEGRARNAIVQLGARPDRVWRRVFIAG